MHDILEGLAQYELKLLFVYFKEQHVTLGELNSRIQSFDYGFMERNSRPVTVNLGGESNDLGLTAAQSWCLLRNVPLMFGDLVSSTDQHCGQFLLLQQTVNIVFSPMFSQDLCVYLKHLIVEHHKLFKMLYPQKNFYQSTIFISIILAASRK